MFSEKFRVPCLANAFSSFPSPRQQIRECPGSSLMKVLADYDSVASRTSIKETCADTDHETVVSSPFLGSVSKGKRERDQNVVRTLRHRQNLHKILERKAELAVGREKLAEQRLYEAEADVEVKHWGKRNSDTALYEINQEFESQRLQLQQANQWTDQAQRQKNKLVWRLFRESQTTYCQEIEELRRTCCEEADRARQARIHVLCVHQERNPKTVSQLLTQIQDLQNKVNSLSDAREFYDPETASSSGATHVPSQPSAFSSPRTMPCRDSGLPHGTRNIMGTSGNVFQRLTAPEEQLLLSSTIPRIWQPLLKS